MANTLSSRTFRDKYRLTTLDQALRTRLVAEKICMVDRSNNLRIQSPYASTPTVVVQALSGSYSVADYTTTDDTLTVTDEFIVAEHIRDFESLLSNFDLFASRYDIMAANVAIKIDSYVLNSLAKNGTGTYTTAVGGFSTVANVNKIMGDLIALVSGYAEMYNGLYLVLETTEMSGLIQAQAANGFNYADSALKNGFITNYMGVDIFIVRPGLFVSATVGTITFANSGKRIFGVKNMSTYAAPRGINVEEKEVSLKTGKEVVVYGYIGHKFWTPKTALGVTITLA
jgi:hypothetical protein